MLEYIIYLIAANIPFNIMTNLHIEHFWWSLLRYQMFFSSIDVSSDVIHTIL